MLDCACDAHPDSALFHSDVESEFEALRGPAITPRQVMSFASRFGSVLREAGMRAGDRVAIAKTNHVDYFFLQLAIVRAGGVAVPVNGGMDVEKLARYLEYTGSRMLVTDARTFAERTGGDPARLPMVDTWLFPDAPPGFAGAEHVDVNRALESAPEQREPAVRQPGDAVIIAHTSGTTGFPKGVVATARSVTTAVKAHYIDEPVTTRNRTGIAGHFSHLVYQPGLYSSLLSNMPVWTMSPLDARHVLRTIERERLNIFFAFPDVFLRMFTEGLDSYDLSSMRIWVATADASHEVHMREFCRQGGYVHPFGLPLLGSVFIEVLGSSEVGSGALRRIRFRFSPGRSDRLLGRPSVGGPSVRIADSAGRTCRAGVPGRVLVRGPTVSRAYWGDTDAREDAPGGWVWTGDVGYRDRLRRFHHLDRAVDAIETPTGPVYTLPVEEVMLKHPSVGEAAVVGIAGPDGAELPVAIVHPRPGASVDESELLGWTRARLSAPLARVIATTPAEIPRGLTGKVLKRELRQRFAGALTDQPRAAAQN